MARARWLNAGIALLAMTACAESLGDLLTAPEDGWAVGGADGMGVAGGFSAGGYASLEGGAAGFVAGVGRLAGNQGGAAGSGEASAVHHVLLRRSAAHGRQPALALAGSKLGLAFTDADQIRFGLRDASRESFGSFSFVGLPQVLDSTAAAPLLTGDDGGFDLLWTSVNSDSGAESLLRVRLDPDGQLVAGPSQMATGTSERCSAATGGGARALACYQAGGLSVWLCPPVGDCEPVTLDTPQGLGWGGLRPGIAWDGEAFALLVNGSDLEQAWYLLARLSAAGEVLLPLVTLALADPLEGWEPLHTSMQPAICSNGAELAIAYGTAATLATIDRSGELTGGPWPLSAYRQSHSWASHQVVCTAAGYSVLTSIDWPGGLEMPARGDTYLYALDPALPDQVLRLELSTQPPRDARIASLAQASGRLITAYESGLPDGDHVLAHAELAPATLEVLAGPELVLSPAGELRAKVVRCDHTACLVLAGQPAAAIGPGQYAYGLWRVAGSNHEVTEPTSLSDALGAASAVAGQAPSQLPVTLTRPGESDPSELRVWGADGTVTGYSLPDATPYGYGPAFLEGDSVRVFLSERVGSRAFPLLQVLVDDGQVTEPAPVGEGWVYAHCGDSYYALYQNQGIGRGTVKRWRPGQDEAFAPLIELPYTFLGTLCCSDALIAVEGWHAHGSAQWSVYTPEGELTATLELEPRGFRGCTSAGEDLIVVTHAWPGKTRVHVITPEGSVRSLRFDLPEDAMRPLGWAVEANEHELVWAWHDQFNGDAYLSFCEL